MSVAGLVLAAGGSRRLGEPKQLLTDADGLPLVVRAARQMLHAGCTPLRIVVGGHAARLSAEIAAHSWPAPVQLVLNGRWSDGMGTSIAAGIAQLAGEPPECAAALIAACDMPAVTADHLRTLLEASAGGTRRAASTYPAPDGTMVHGIPAVLPRADWSWLLALEGDRGARPLLQSAETAHVPLVGGSLDLDTPDDVAQWRHHHLSHHHIP